MIAPGRVMKPTLALLACLISVGCTELEALFEEGPVTCEQACEDNYIGCLEWAFEIDVEYEQGPYNPRQYPPQQTTTTTRRVPSKAKEERCRLDFERCQRGCVEAAHEADNLSQAPSTSD